MAKWIELLDAEDLQPGQKKCKTAGTMPVVVCNVDGTLTAFQNMCPHAGLPLGDGAMHGKVITCPFHGYAYNVESGKNVDFADDIPLKMYPVRVEDGKVQIEMPE